MQMKQNKQKQTNKHMKFILSVVDNSPEESRGGVVNYDTAKNLPIEHSERINSIRISDTILRYNTGFIPEPIKRNKYLTEEEKTVYLKAQAEALKVFKKELLGSEKADLDENNKYFWQDSKNGVFEITRETTRTLYNTENIPHLLLYWQILSDAYSLIGVNLDHALSKNAPYFLQEVKDAELRESKLEMTQLDALGILNDFKVNGDSESLLKLTWVLGTKENKLLGFTKSAQIPTLAKALFSFINGDLSDNKKSKNVKDFTTACTELKADVDTFNTKMIIKVLDYHGKIFVNKENKYVTESGILLGNSIKECIEKLCKKNNSDLLLELTDEATKIIANDL